MIISEVCNFYRLDETTLREQRMVENLISRRVDGLVLVPASLTQDYLAPELRAGFPVVFADRVPNGVDTDSVTIDHTLGGFMAADHLLAIGHRRIAGMGAARLQNRKAQIETRRTDIGHQTARQTRQDARINAAPRGIGPSSAPPRASRPLLGASWRLLAPHDPSSAHSRRISRRILGASSRLTTPPPRLVEAASA